MGSSTSDLRLAIIEIEMERPLQIVAGDERGSWRQAEYRSAEGGIRANPDVLSVFDRPAGTRSIRMAADVGRRAAFDDPSAGS